MKTTTASRSRSATAPAALGTTTRTPAFRPRLEIVSGYFEPDGTPALVASDQSLHKPLCGILMPMGCIHDEAYDMILDTKPGKAVELVSTTGLSTKVVRRMTTAELDAHLARFSLR